MVRASVALRVAEQEGSGDVPRMAAFAIGRISDDTVPFQVAGLASRSAAVAQSEARGLAAPDDRIRQSAGARADESMATRGSSRLAAVMASGSPPPKSIRRTARRTDTIVRNRWPPHHP
jgi:hypothetical protein